MPDHEDSLGGETVDGDAKAGRAEQSLGDGATMGGDTAAHSLGDQSTFGDANVDDELFDDEMEVVDLTTRYTEEGVLGKGGMGEVILATDTRLNRKVAIKRIIGKAARSKTAIQRFLTEAQSIAALNHTNIVQIYEFGRDDNGPFLIMECVQGGSLLEKCKAGPIELDEAVNIFGQLCDGLAKAHAAGIIHRDIKPANVLMTEDGVPKLTDFGLAKDDTADTGMTMEGAVIGTLDFMPPEQRQAAELTDHRSDLWSLAATFYQMLTGEPPRVIDLDLLPPAIRPALAKSLKSKKEDRFQSAMEMREAMLQAHSGKMDRSRTLSEGECPQCATPNPPHGKFCVDCGAVLQIQCLQCEAEIQIWNRACGECGSLQEPLVDKKLSDLKEIHDDAESLLADLEFDAAAKKAAVIANESDSRLQQFAMWHEDFSARLNSLRTLEHARLKELLQEALTHEQAYDYEASLKTLQQIASPLKQTTLTGITGTAKQITKRLTTKHLRLKELEDIVDEQVAEREIGELLPIVNELLKLKPDRAKVQKLKTQLEKRDATRDATIKQAIQQLSEQQYAGAVATLNTVSEEVSDVEILKLKTKASDFLKRLNHLRGSIKTSIKDGQLIGLLPVVEECLTLKADQDDLVKFKKELIAREAQLDVRNQEIIAKAQTHMQQLQFDAAIQLLDTIGTKHQSSTTAAISQRAKYSISSGDPLANTLGLTLNYIPAGTFMMGISAAEKVRLLQQQPKLGRLLFPLKIENEHQHKVTITKPFYMQTTVVTQLQWKTLMGTEPWTGRFFRKFSVKKTGANYPAIYVNWNDGVSFCKKLSEKEGKTYRLPTEAEWEYACRAGTQTPWNFGAGGFHERDLANYVWWFDNTYAIDENYAHQVGLKRPNAFGLFDMHGNVWEWCHDYYAADYYMQSPEKDPTGPALGDHRVSRGGAWYSGAIGLRPTIRCGSAFSLNRTAVGFRVVRELD